MNRGAVVMVAIPGDFGKPRPALVVQNRAVTDWVDSILVCPMTSSLVEAPLFRIEVDANDQTGLDKPSQIMVEKITAVRPKRIGQTLGRVDGTTMQEVNQSMSFVLGLES